MRGNRRKYDYERWFDDHPTVIVRGVDYHCSQSTMSQALRNRASMMGINISLVDTGDTIEVRVVLKKKKARSEVHHTDKAPVAH